MKGLINLKNSKKDTTKLFSHIDYHIGDNYKNEQTDMICYKCGKCGRKFNEIGILIK